MTAQPIQHQTKRLLEQIRTRVAEPHRLEQTCGDRRELQQRPREITRLRSLRAHLITQQPDGRQPAA
jgi:hypothetical protein